MNALIENNRKKIEAICRKNSVKELYIFGSVLTSDFSDQSDLDFAYVLNDELSPLEYGDAFFGLLEDLQELFQRKIDLVSYRVVKNPIFKQELDRTKQSVYAAA